MMLRFRMRARSVTSPRSVTMLHGLAPQAAPGAPLGYPTGGAAIVSRSPTTPSAGRAVANIKSQIKRNRQNEKARVRNKAVRSELKTRVKTAVSSAGTDTQVEAMREAVKRIDKAASKGVIHKNAAARK